MKYALVIHSNDPETVWNAIRFGVHALSSGETVKIFLLGKGVEAEDLDNESFKITELMQTFIEQGGEFLACGSCLKLRQRQGNQVCPLSTMDDLYRLISESDRVLTF